MQKHNEITSAMHFCVMILIPVLILMIIYGLVFDFALSVASCIPLIAAIKIYKHFNNNYKLK